MTNAVRRLLITKEDIMKKTLLFIFGFWFSLPFCCSLQAQADVTEPEALAVVKTFVDEGIKFLKSLPKNKEISKANVDSFHNLLRKYLDFKAIAIDLVGHGIWNKMDAAKQMEYVDAFENMIVYDYVRRFQEYSDQKVLVNTARIKPSRAGVRADVLCALTSDFDSKPTALVWEVHRAEDGNIKVTDLTVAGISMAITMKAEFKQIRRQHGGMEGLIKYLRTKAKK